VDITFKLVDNYEVRNEILALLQRHSTAWFDAALTRAPTELQATLQVKAEHSRQPWLLLRNLSQKYLAVTQVTSSNEATELGASLAAHFAREISASERNLSRVFHLVGVCICVYSSTFPKGSLAAISVWKPDRTKALASQIASKSYFSGEIAGLRLSRRTGKTFAPSLSVAQRDF
jgi:phosphatidylinositol 4-kinase